MAILNLLWWVYCQQWVSTLKINSSANVFSFFRLDNNWLPIRPNTKWPMAQLFKGRHRKQTKSFWTSRRFLNNVQIFLNIAQRTFDSKVLFLCSLYPQKYFFLFFGGGTYDYLRFNGKCRFCVFRVNGAYLGSGSVQVQLSTPTPHPHMPPIFVLQRPPSTQRIRMSGFVS